MAGFWAGFGTQFSKEVGEIRKELREDSRTRRNYIEANGGRIVANTRKKADEILAMVNEAKAKGVAEDALLGMYQQSGATGIRKFYAALMKRPNLNAEDFKSISDIGREWAKDTDLSLTDTILRGMNVYSDPDAGPEERKQNFFQGIISGGAGNDNFMSEKMYGGYTGYDIKRMESGVEQSSTEGGIDVLSLVGPAPKTPRVQAQNLTNLMDRFKKNLPMLLNIKNGRVAELTSMLSDGTSTAESEEERAEIVEDIFTLNKMKEERYTQTSLVQYAKDFDPSMYEYMSKIEAADGGSYSRNSELTEMWGNYKGYEQTLKNNNLHFVSDEEQTGRQKAIRHADEMKRQTGKRYDAFVLIDDRVIRVSSED